MLCNCKVTASVELCNFRHSVCYFRHLYKYIGCSVRFNLWISSLLFYYSALVFIGGVLDINQKYLQSSTRAVNPSFDEHILRSAWKQFDPEVDLVYPTTPRKRFMYTALSYMLSSAAARYLVNHVDTHGFISVADFTLVKLLDLIPGCYATHTQLVLVPKTTKDEIAADDSDVQRNSAPVPGAPHIAKPMAWKLSLIESKRNNLTVSQYNCVYHYNNHAFDNDINQDIDNGIYNKKRF